jgi:hypothetical protein
MSNLFKDKFPDLLKEWDYEKNTIDLETLTYGSNKKVWWLCSKNHSFSSTPKNKFRSTEKKYKGCPYCSNQKVGYGNDLKTNFPDIAKEWDYEKNSTTPKDYTLGSDKKVFWLCSKNHSFESKIYSRTFQQKGCPYCSNHKVGYGNDLKTNFPDIAKEWDYEKNSTTPDNIAKLSNSKFWWKCLKGHSFEMTVNNRTSKYQLQNCPYCSNKKVGYGNDLKTNFPDIAKEWDYEKNLTTPDKVMPATNKKYWWLCKFKHSYNSSPNARVLRKTGCPYCAGQKVGYGNDLKTNFPDIAKEWDYEKNSTTPDKVMPYSNLNYWWLCKEKHSYKSSGSNRVNLNRSCPYCSNQKIGYGNDLKSRYPKSLKEWDYEKNSTTPDKIFPGTHKKAWWICSQGHSFKVAVYSKVLQETGCPYCTLTPRSREEVYLLFELKRFFDIDENDHKIKLKRVEDVDIKLAIEKVVIEYDGAYWHKDKAERDKAKTKALEKAGWTVIRVREKPLKILSRKYNVSSKTGEYKETANKVLKKLNQLGYEVKGLDKYLERKTLINKKEAEKYIDKLLKEKNKK